MHESSGLKAATEIGIVGTTFFNQGLRKSVKWNRENYQGWTYKTNGEYADSNDESTSY